jgi:hypothetical protein
MWRWSGLILSATRLITVDPRLVRESAPSTTPSSNATAMIVVPVNTLASTDMFRL